MDNQARQISPASWKIEIGWIGGGWVNDGKQEEQISRKTVERFY